MAAAVAVAKSRSVMTDVSPGERARAQTTVFFLHFLGGSANSWSEVIARLHPALRCIAIDLAGFGDAAQAPGYTIADMADAVAAMVIPHAPQGWALVGHSMGAKIAMAVARRAESGDPMLAGLTALITLAGSPPGPEPMAEAQRAAMLGWFADGPDASRAQARSYIEQNIAVDLTESTKQRAIADVLRVNRAAWTAWLEAGSREDWSARIGVLDTPALLVTGGHDDDLGSAAQHRLTAPHLANHRIVSLTGASHLLPIEMPDAVAALIAGHVMRPRRTIAVAPAIDPEYLALIQSDRVSTGTRAILLARAAHDGSSDRSRVLDETELMTLRAVLDRVIPQTAATAIDLATPIVAAFALGNGWRFARLPPDAQAYRLALLTLDLIAHARHDRRFSNLEPDEQDQILLAISEGALGGTDLDAGQMKLWFEDLRSDAARAYMAHPATLARIGYSGIGYGGDGEPKPGFVCVGYGERESWEPSAAP